MDIVNTAHLTLNVRKNGRAPKTCQWILSNILNIDVARYIDDISKYVVKHKSAKLIKT